MSRNPSRRIFRPRALFIPAALAAGGLLAGCSSGEKAVRPLTAEQFAARNGVTLDGGRDEGTPIDRPGALQYDVPDRVAAAPPAVTAQDSVVGNVENPNPDPRPRQIDPAVGHAVKGPYSEQGSTRPAADGGPAEQIDLRGAGRVRPATNPGGQALDVFFVIMEVNGKPIFSHKVLQSLEKRFEVEAKKHDRNSFRDLAAESLARQIQGYKLDELEVAWADKSLNEEDKRIAAAMTMQWRMNLITAAGGSEQVARSKAAQEGWDFEEMVNQQYRVHLVRYCYQKRVQPLVQVSASAIREYYNRNKEKEFSKPGRMKFRLIRINPNVGFASKEEAGKFAEEIRKRAQTEDFTTLASDPKINDDSIARGHGGYFSEDGWVETASFPNEAVKKAILSLRPGEVTDIVENNQKYYIAKVEAIDQATVQPFEDQQVQERIKRKLESQQIQAMREQNVSKLDREAVSVRKPGAMQALLNIVMSRYPEWSGKAPAKGG